MTYVVMINHIDTATCKAYDTTDIKSITKMHVHQWLDFIISQKVSH